MNEIYLATESTRDLKFFQTIRTLENKLLLKRIVKKVKLSNDFEPDFKKNHFN